jgi:hypothetical protein
MYNKFHKGELIKSETTIDSTFPANREIELWKNTELKRFEVLERPVISLFENDVEHERFVQDLIKGLYLGRDIDDSKNFNSILYGCELDKETLTNGDVYTTLTPGIFIYENKVYQIYPTCYIASRQLEKEAELTTENGLEYINIKYENEKFSADIKVGSYHKEKISGDITRGIVLLEKIKTYLDGKIAYRHSGHEVPEVINISTSLEKFQLEPVFKSTTTKQWVKFNGTEIINENLGPNVSEQFIFGGHHKNDDMDFKDVKKWAGFNTSVYKKYSVTNEKLDYMPSLTLKGNILGNNEHPADLEKGSIVSSFQLVTTDTPQSIEETKTFTADQEIENDINLVFKNSSGEHGWNIKNNASDSLLIIKGEATPEAILTIDNDKDVSFAAKDFSIDGANISLTGVATITGATTITGETSIIGDTAIDGNLNITKELEVEENTRLLEDLYVGEDTTLDGTLEVDGVTTLNGNLTVAGAKSTTLTGTLDVTGVTSLSSTLGVTSKTTLSDELEVNGVTTLNNNLTVTGAKSTTLTGTLSVTGAATLSNALGVAGAATLDNTLGVAGATTLSDILDVTGKATLSDELAVTGATTLSSTLGVTDKTTLLDDLEVGGATTLTGPLGVTGATSLTTLSTSGKSTLESLEITNNTDMKGSLSIKSGATNKFTINNTTGNTETQGTFKSNKLITAVSGITSSGDIETTSGKDIKSANDIEANADITSITGILNLNRRDFSINLGEDSGAYDWRISKAENDSMGDIEITSRGNKVISISNSGILKAEEFKTNTPFEINELNVEQFNGHTIVKNETSALIGDSGEDFILWKSPTDKVIKKIKFNQLPQAREEFEEDAEILVGLMTSENLKRISDLEMMAGWTTEGGVKNLVGSVNKISPVSGGGNVQIDTTHIHLVGDSGDTLSTRLIENASELDRLATQVPSNNTYNNTANQVIISVKNDNPVWGKITDNQINSTITKISPYNGEGHVNNVSRSLVDGEYPLALWNTTGTTLAGKTLQHNDIVYSASTSTLTATNVTSRSSRALKKDIEIYKESAFDTLDKIDIVSFHFKDDATQADKVGFIAEDSPSLVAGLNHDKMDMNNCIGLLIKAVQELREENKELRNELNNIRNS